MRRRRRKQNHLLPFLYPRDTATSMHGHIATTFDKRQNTLATQPSNPNLDTFRTKSLKQKNHKKKIATWLFRKDKTKEARSDDKILCGTFPRTCAHHNPKICRKPSRRANFPFANTTSPSPSVFRTDTTSAMTFCIHMVLRGKVFRTFRVHTEASFHTTFRNSNLETRIESSFSLSRNSTRTTTFSNTSGKDHCDTEASIHANKKAFDHKSLHTCAALENGRSETASLRSEQEHMHTNTKPTSCSRARFIFPQKHKYLSGNSRVSLRHFGQDQP
jgi:hypothetical protein